MKYKIFFYLGLLMAISACKASQENVAEVPTASQISSTVQISTNTPGSTTTNIPTPAATATQFPASTAVQPLSTEELGTQNSVAVLGKHQVMQNETLSCIGRGYGVVPNAIAEANDMELTDILYPGQTLDVPEVEWLSIPAGPVCVTQFDSPFSGLPITGPYIPQPTSLTSLATPIVTMSSTQSTPEATITDVLPTATLSVPNTPEPTPCHSRVCLSTPSSENPN